MGEICRPFFNPIRGTRMAVASGGILPSCFAASPLRAWPSEQEDTHVNRRRLAAAAACLAVLTGCGPAPQPSPLPASSTSLPSASVGSVLTDLSVIGCARDDPADEGELTGAWAGNDSGTYYIRQVGACVWWFGTEVRDVELGPTGQRGFANVASGRIVGTQLDLEWADVPLGDTVNGGGLTFTYDEANNQLTLVAQRGGRIPFGGTVLTRIDPATSPAPTPSPSASP
jgi:hypothetical protein